MEKILFLESYIERCDWLLHSYMHETRGYINETKDSDSIIVSSMTIKDTDNKKIVAELKDQAKRLQNEIIGTFQGEIKHIERQLDGYYLTRILKIIKRKPIDDDVDYFWNISCLKAKLVNHQANLERENLIKNKEFELELAKNPKVNVTQILDNAISNSINIQISFEQTVQAISNIRGYEIDDEEKEELISMLSKVEKAKNDKDKSKLSSKVGSVLKYIADKGIEVGIAALPYIMAALKSAQTSP